MNNSEGRFLNVAAAGFVADKRTFDLSSSQEVIWFDQMLYPEVPHYNIGMAVELRGDIDSHVLESAIQNVANRRSALSLRTVLRKGAERPRQEVLDTVTIELPVVDFPADAEGEKCARAYMQAVFSRPFDLYDRLLWDCCLVRLGPLRCYWMHRYHHLATDGMGISLIGHAVAEAYNAILSGQGEPEEADAGASYFDFLAEEKAYLASDRFERDRNFWTARFSQLPAPLVPPKDDAPAGKLLPGAHKRWTIPRPLYAALTDFSKSHGLSFVHLLLAAISVYFARVSHADEVMIGVPVHNRGAAKYKRTPGLFVSVNPIGIKVDPFGSFLDLMHEVAAELRRCYRHQRFPIAEINRHLQLARSGRRQLHDVALSFLSLDVNASFGSTIPKVRAMDNGYEQTPLAILAQDYSQAEDVVVDFNYNTRYFDESSIAGVQSGIEVLLEKAIPCADVPVRHLPLLTEVELRRQLVEWNDTASSYPSELCVHQLFEAQAAKTPDAIALAWEDRRLSYGELNRQSNRLAHYLRACGVGPDVRVGICVERSPEMIVAVMAVMKAGGAYVPLDPDYPKERLAYMLRDAAPAMLLTQKRLKGVLSDSGVPAFLLDSNASALDGHSDDNPRSHPLPRSLAYVLYTSGSTGKPKGVMIEHRSLTNLVCLQAQRLRGARSVMQFASLNFDMSVEEIFPALISGATLVIRPAEMLAPDASFLKLIEHLSIEALNLPTAFWHEWIHQIDAEESAIPTAVRTVSVGGEKVNAERYQQWARQPRARSLSWNNAYGPTETAVNACCFEVRPRDAFDGVEVPIGRPIANTRVYILDEALNLMPTGATGELYIAGDGVARGYMNRPELTAERFIPDPFGAVPGATMYRTGDLARYLPDGQIEYLGRADHQIKIRGFRIEPGEIEAALSALPYVKEAVVLAREDVPGDKRLAAYLVAQREREVPETAVLRRDLAKRLPDYMVPFHFTVLERMPLTANGKVDRKALPAPDMERSGVDYVAPTTPIEKALADIWAEVLELDRVGIHDNFFELGGHSLMAMRVLTKVVEMFEVRPPAHAFFEIPTIAQIAPVIEALIIREIEQMTDEQAISMIRE